ncbi:hypothetical protein RRG08_067215, partial [Elysia crispata]
LCREERGLTSPQLTHPSYVEKYKEASTSPQLTHPSYVEKHTRLRHRLNLLIPAM